MNSDVKIMMWVVLGIFAIFAVGIVVDSGSNTRCKHAAMEKHYSADDIIKLCGK